MYVCHEGHEYDPGARAPSACFERMPRVHAEFGFPREAVHNQSEFRNKRCATYGISGRCWPTWGQLRPKPRFRPKLGQFGPKLGPVRSNLAKCCPESRIDRHSPILGRFRPISDRVRPIVARSGQSGPMSTEIGPKVAKLGRFPPDRGHLGWQNDVDHEPLINQHRARRMSRPPPRLVREKLRRCCHQVARGELGGRAAEDQSSSTSRRLAVGQSSIGRRLVIEWPSINCRRIVDYSPSAHRRIVVGISTLLSDRRPLSDDRRYRCMTSKVVTAPALPLQVAQYDFRTFACCPHISLIARSRDGTCGILPPTPSVCGGNTRKGSCPLAARARRRHGAAANGCRRRCRTCCLE